MMNSQPLQNCANNDQNNTAMTELEHRIFSEKVAIYLKLISEATRMLSDNQGSLRRDIWDYLLRIYGREESTVDYRDFLLAIRFLQKQGKLTNDQKGLFQIEPNTFKEIWDNPQPTTPSFNKRSQSSVGNPLITASKRMNNAFSEEAIASGARKQRGSKQLLQQNLHGGIAAGDQNPFSRSLKRAGKSQVNLPPATQGSRGGRINNAAPDTASI